MNDGLDRTIDYVLALTEERDEARAEVERLREALRGLLAFDYESDEDPGPIFDRARAALGDTEHE